MSVLGHVGRGVAVIVVGCIICLVKVGVGKMGETAGVMGWAGGVRMIGLVCEEVVVIERMVEAQEMDVGRRDLVSGGLVVIQRGLVCVGLVVNN